MNFSYTFKNSDTSEEIIEHARTKLEKLAKLEMKPIESAEAKFRLSGKTRYEVELKLHGGNGPIVSHGEGANYADALDVALERMEKQMWRRKDKVQYHKNPEKRQHKAG